MRYAAPPLFFVRWWLAMTVPLSLGLVEDDPVLREELAFQLTHAGFLVETFLDAPALYRRLAVSRFALLLLDIGLEGEDGLSICRYLRTHDAGIGIVFVTARGLRDDRLVGLEAGADAYLTKPLDLAELLLVLRRLAQRQAASAPSGPDGAIMPGGDWHYDKHTAYLTTPNARRVRLSANEARLLGELMSLRGTLRTHEELAATLSLMVEDQARHRIEVILSRLRARVRRETGLTLPIRTERGMGYVFTND